MTTRTLLLLAVLYLALKPKPKDPRGDVEIGDAQMLGSKPNEWAQWPGSSP